MADLGETLAACALEFIFPSVASPSAAVASHKPSMLDERVSPELSRSTTPAPAYGGGRIWDRQ
jgi:hypothetical protein